MTEVQIDVVVPTYRRPEQLERCLRALGAQQHKPATVIVVVRVDDQESKATLARISPEVSSPVLMVEVTEPGVIAAMSAGVARSSTPLVAFTDDDARPRADWLGKIVKNFNDPTVGGVGGRDVIAGQEHPLTENVGRFSRRGKLVGNHHLGTGGARTVDVLKGVNMAFRTEALALPAPGVLRGRGAQVNSEILICSWARQQGWRLVYDSQVVVDHEGAPRPDADRRVRPKPRAVFDSAYNYVIATAVLDRRLPIRRIAYAIAVGTRDRPGIVRAIVAGARGEAEVLALVLPAVSGQIVAVSRLVTRQPARQGQVVVPAALLQTGRPPHRVPVVALVAHDIHDNGGMERVCAELIRRSSGRVQLLVVAASLAPDLRPLVRRWVHVRVPSRPFPLKFLLFWILAGRAVRRLDVDLVHTVGAIVPNRVDIASIHFCHAGFLVANKGLGHPDTSMFRQANTGLTRILALASERWSYRPSRLRTFAAVSRGVAEEVVGYYPEIPAAITPNGVDVERFRPDPEAGAALRGAEDVGDDVVALFVGGDWDRKGLHLTIEALSKVRANGHDLRLWVVGRGDETRFAALAKQFGVAPFVRFFGPRLDTGPYYQAADLFVLPSAYETFSLVCFEAAVCGLPLIIPQLSGASEIVGSDEGGLLVERSAESVAVALVTLTADPALRSRQGAEARRRAATYTWQHSADSMLNLYETLLAERKAKR
jgi:glycosyltransferase involved in cell wall biosynthesis